MHVGLWVAKKFRSLGDAYRQRGIAGVAGIIATKWYFLPLRPMARYVIERYGDRIWLDGCEFSLKTPSLSKERRDLIHVPSYEEAERKLVKRFLDPGLPVIELGAFIGVVSCITNRLLIKPASHAVVEANPAVLDLLNVNRRTNAAQFQIVHAAVGYGQSHLEFFVPENPMAGSTRKSDGQSVRIAVTGVKEVSQRFGFDRFSLIADIEGSELELIENEGELLAERAATMIIEFHPHMVGDAATNLATQRLTGLGFEVLGCEGTTYVFRNKRSII